MKDIVFLIAGWEEAREPFVISEEVSWDEKRRARSGKRLPSFFLCSSFDFLADLHD